MFEGLSALLVGRVCTARQLLIDSLTLRVEVNTPPAVDRWWIVGKLVLIGEVVIWFIVQALAKPRTTNYQCIMFLLLSYQAP